MIPYPYNMVDMGGIDLAEANGTVVDGLYAKIVEAVNACGDVVLYNWKFAGIEIAPQHTTILLGDPITINGAVQVTKQDEVIVPGINPDPTVIVSLTAVENGVYAAKDYDAGAFNPVNVIVPPPTLVALTADSNGSYLPPEGAAGFSSVLVDIVGTDLLSVNINGGYNGGANITISYKGVQFFSAVGSSPYNLSYTPNSYSGTVEGHVVAVSIPSLRSDTSYLNIIITCDEVNYLVGFAHQGNNTSYGYGNQKIEIAI